MKKFKLFLNLFFYLTMAVFVASCVPGQGNPADPLSNGGGSGSGGSTASGGTNVVISSFSPTGAMVLNPSSATRALSVTAVSPKNATLSFTFTRINTVTSAVTALETNLTGLYTLDPSTIPIGGYTIRVVASDGSTDASHDWSVRINTSPTITLTSPAITGKGVSIGNTLGLNGTIADADGDALTATWLLNGVVSASLVDGGVAAGVASATLTGGASFAGNNSVVLSVTDGYTTTTYTWTINVNYLNSVCNNLTQGQVCTYVGPPSGKGSGKVPNASDVYFDYPISMDFDAQGMYIVDGLDIYAEYFTLWYYNRSGGSVVRGGVTIAAGTAAIIAGNGANAGPGASGGLLSNTNMYSPRAVVVNQSGGEVYVAAGNGGNFKFTPAASIQTSTLLPAQAFTTARYRNVGGEDRIYFGEYTTHKIRYMKISDGTLTDVAGTGAVASTGDGGAATAASVNNVRGLAFDSNDNIYVAENGSNKVRIICTTIGAGICAGANVVDAGGTNLVMTGGTQAAVAGRIYTLVGTGAYAWGGENVVPTAAAFVSPGCVEVITGGHIAFCETYRVRLLNTSNAPISYAGTTVNAYSVATIAGVAGLGFPMLDGDVATSGNLSNVISLREDPTTGDLFIGTLYGDATYATSFGQIRQVNKTTGIITTIAGNTTSGWIYLQNANGILATKAQGSGNYSVLPMPNGELIYTDSSMGLKKVGVDGIVNKVGSTHWFIGPTIDGGRMEDSGAPSSNQLSRYGTESVLIGAYTGIVSFWNRSASLISFGGLSIFADTVRYLTGAWGYGGAYTASNATALTSTHGIITGVTNDGTNAYFSDSTYHCVRKIDAAGALSTVAGTCNAAGSGGANVVATAGALNGPYQLAFDVGSGLLAIADSTNARVRIVNTSAVAVTAYNVTINPGNMAIIAGGGATNYTDGIAATAAVITTPRGVAFEPSTGDLYYADNSQALVRKVIRDGANAGKVYTIYGNTTAAYTIGRIPWDNRYEGVAATTVAGWMPAGLAFDSSGDLYIAQQSGQLVKKVKLSP